MTKRQIRLLIRWLVRERITYEAAEKRLLRTFGVKTSSGSLSKFYYRYCQVRPKQPPSPPPALVDVIMVPMPNRQWRFVLLGRHKAARVFALEGGKLRALKVPHAYTPFRN